MNYLNLTFPTSNRHIKNNIYLVIAGWHDRSLNFNIDGFIAQINGCNMINTIFQFVSRTGNRCESVKRERFSAWSKHDVWVIVRTYGDAYSICRLRKVCYGTRGKLIKLIFLSEKRNHEPFNFPGDAPPKSLCNFTITKVTWCV